MINQNLERRLKDGRSSTINLPYEKTRIEGDIGFLERTKKSMKADSKEYETLQLKLNYLNRLHDMINKAIVKQREMNTRMMIVQNGQKRSIEEVENELQEREWLQRQELRIRHPEFQ